MAEHRNLFGEIVDPASGTVVEQPLYYGPRPYRKDGDMMWDRGVVLDKWVELENPWEKGVYGETVRLLSKYMHLDNKVRREIAGIIRYVRENVLPARRGSPKIKPFARLLAYVVLKRHRPTMVLRFLRENRIKSLSSKISEYGLGIFLNKSPRGNGGWWSLVFHHMTKLLEETNMSHLYPIATTIYMELRKRDPPVTSCSPSCVAAAIVKMATLLTGDDYIVTQNVLAEIIGRSSACIYRNELWFRNVLGIRVTRTPCNTVTEVELPEDLYEKLSPFIGCTDAEK